MPESTSPRKSESIDKDIAKIGNPEKRAAAEAQREAKRERQAREFKPVPTWYKAIMFGLMIVGLLWIVTYYIAAMVGVGLPIPGINNWNIMIGFGLALVGFIMMMGWRD
ncbi:cell division protein CrgA [Galactobacter valiniphilus]|uniref:cell division protein CrgA n=1 Tax=Galactobacter valiniphilus TaxID=2676122 RepID=UPI001F1BE302|nr:cell division protein CrgA [Galactobacter valiniphilus]